MIGLPRSARNLFTTLPLFALLLNAACTCGSGPYEGDYFDGDRPETMKGVKFVESEKGDPKIVGCSDGQREGFADLKKHPRVAACVGAWDGGKSLRDQKTGTQCGDDGGKCGVPADLCAEGWHVCGHEGKPQDLAERATANDCNNAGPGRFNAALSHSPTDEINPCPTIRKTTILPCVQAGLGSEPVCCGNDCLAGKCKDGVYKNKTKISRGTTEGCGAVTSDRNGGILCCYDGDDNPAAAADTKEGAAEAGAAEAGVAEAGDTKEGAAEAGDTKEGDGKADAKGDAKGDEKKGDEKKGDAKKGDAKKDDAKKEAKEEKEEPKEAKGG